MNHRRIVQKPPEIEKLQTEPRPSNSTTMTNLEITGTIKHHNRTAAVPDYESNQQLDIGDLRLTYRQSKRGSEVYDHRYAACVLPSEGAHRRCCYSVQRATVQAATPLTESANQSQTRPPGRTVGNPSQRDSGADHRGEL